MATTERDTRPTASLVHSRLVEDLKALNADLRRNQIDPLVSVETATALDVEHLRAAVKATADYLVDVARKMRGL